MMRIPNKMNVWKGKIISLVGRVTLINYVLSSIPFYFFSIFKALKAVIQENRKCINLVSWNSICKPKLEGDHGIKNVGVFNLAFLGKWAWRLISNSSSIWYSLL